MCNVRRDTGNEAKINSTSTQGNKNNKDEQQQGLQNGPHSTKKPNYKETKTQPTTNKSVLRSQTNNVNCHQRVPNHAKKKTLPIEAIIGHHQQSNKQRKEHANEPAQVDKVSTRMLQKKKRKQEQCS